MSKLIECKKCGYRFEQGSKACPNCSNKAPIDFKKILYIVLAVAAAIIFVIFAVKMILDDGVVDLESSSQTDLSSVIENSSTESDTVSNQESGSSSNFSAPAITTNTNTSNNDTKFKQPTDNDNNITVANDGTVSITIPKWFLLKIEPDYDYKLTDKEANIYKFKSVTKNADGSATYTVSYNDYHKFLLTSKSAVNAVVYEYSNNVWFSKIEADEGYNNIKIYTKYDSLDNFDEGFGIYISLSGLQASFYQYMHYDYNVGTTITVYNKDNVVLGTYKFPELLK